MSCSHPDLGRYAGYSEPYHCGNCLPCIIRRAAIEFAYNEDSSLYRDKDFRSISASENLRSFKLGIKDFERQKINLALSVQISGQISDNLDEYCDVYKRGMNELKLLLDKYNG